LILVLSRSQIIMHNSQSNHSRNISRVSFSGVHAENRAGPPALFHNVGLSFRFIRFERAVFTIAPANLARIGLSEEWKSVQEDIEEKFSKRLRST